MDCCMLLILNFQIYAELKRLAKAYKDHINLFEVGKSFENITIYGIQVWSLLFLGFKT